MKGNLNNVQFAISLIRDMANSGRITRKEIKHKYMKAMEQEESHSVNATVDKAIKALTLEGFIERINRGVYIKIN